jgi:hypothetical protein
MTNLKEAISKAPVSRVTRVPVSQRNILTVKGKDPAYEYRVVNDTEDRIAQFIDGGYELVDDNSTDVGDKRVSQGTAVSSKKIFSVGQGTKGYLMRIKKEWYQEDQEKKQEFVNMQEASIKEKALDGNYGKLDITRD